MTSLFRAIVAVVIAGLSAGCGVSASEGGKSRLQVFAASSLTDVFQQIEPSARFNFAGSDELATQIRHGARPDIYAAASERIPAELFTEGLIEQPIVFASNRLVVITPADHPAVTSIDDLRQSGIRLVIGAEGVPVGDYTRMAWKRLGKHGLHENVVSVEQDTRSIVAKVALGEADAGFVYTTDAIAAGRTVSVIQLPPEAQPRVPYLMAVVTGGEYRKLAGSFLRRVIGASGRAALSRAGFGPP